MKVTAIIACHNRQELTSRCLGTLFDQGVPSDVEIDAVVVDDGSVDGTAEAVLARFPAVNLLQGDGSLFWAGAMEIAERAALAESPDYLLWLNDDVALDPDALMDLIQTSASRAGGCIAVGALRDPTTLLLTYSGVRRRGRHPLRMDLVAPANEPVEVETFNGNAVLVPRQVALRVGPFDGGFEHKAADYDYGLRAGRAGVMSLLAPGTVGTCAREGAPSQLVHRVPLRVGLSALLGPKGFPPRSTARYLRRHGGALWPAYWIVPYAKAAIMIPWRAFASIASRGARAARR